jgi:hypothetical protein
LLENEEVGAALRHRQGFASGQEQLHFNMRRVAGGGME